MYIKNVPMCVRARVYAWVHVFKCKCDSMHFNRANVFSLMKAPACKGSRSVIVPVKQIRVKKYALDIVSGVTMLMIGILLWNKLELQTHHLLAFELIIKKHVDGHSSHRYYSQSHFSTTSQILAAFVAILIAEIPSFGIDCASIAITESYGVITRYL